jgi:hypothetical protein
MWRGAFEGWCGIAFYESALTLTVCEVSRSGKCESRRAVAPGGGSCREQRQVVLGAKKDCNGSAPAARRGAPRSRHPRTALRLSQSPADRVRGSQSAQRVLSASSPLLLGAVGGSQDTPLHTWRRLSTSRFRSSTATWRRAATVRVSNRSTRRRSRTSTHSSGRSCGCPATTTGPIAGADMGRQPSVSGSHRAS